MAHEPDELKGRWAHVPRPAVCAAPVRPVPVVERSPVPGTGDPAPGEGAYRYGPPGTGVRYDRYRIGYRSALPVPLGRTGTARPYRYEGTARRYRYAGYRGVVPQSFGRPGVQVPHPAGAEHPVTHGDGGWI